MGKSKVISTSVPPELAEQIDQVAEITNQSRAAVIRSSIELIAALPLNVLWGFLKFYQEGTEADREILQHDITRVFLNYQYRLGHRALAKTIDQKFLDTLETEEDIINAAILLTKKTKKSV